MEHDCVDACVRRLRIFLLRRRPQVPEGHRERMLRAELSFFWHRVYDPRSKTCVHFCSAAPELAGTSEVPALPTTAGGTDFLGCVGFVDMPRGVLRLAVPVDGIVV